MQTTRLSNRQLIIIIVLTLFLHSGILLILIVPQSMLHNPFSILLPKDDDPINQLVQKQTEWAARKARTQPFTPIFFEEGTETKQDAITSPQTDTVQEHLVQETTATQTPTIEDQENHKEAQLTAEIDNKLSTVAPAQAAPKKIADQTPKAPHQPSIFKRPLVPTNAPTTTQSESGKSSPQKKLSLAQLAQGFMTHIQNNGDSAVTIIGKENAIPTDEQLKHERYIERLTWALQQSLKINRGKEPPYNTDKSLQIYMALNKNGTIKTLQLVSSCGIKALDDFMLFVFRDASSSFPPVPDYLLQDQYTIIYTVELYRLGNPLNIFRQ